MKVTRKRQQDPRVDRKLGIRRRPAGIQVRGRRFMELSKRSLYRGPREGELSDLLRGRKVVRTRPSAGQPKQKKVEMVIRVVRGGSKYN